SPRPVGDAARRPGQPGRLNGSGSLSRFPQACRQRAVKDIRGRAREALLLLHPPDTRANRALHRHVVRLSGRPWMLRCRGAPRRASAKNFSARTRPALAADLELGASATLAALGVVWYSRARVY